MSRVERQAEIEVMKANIERELAEYEAAIEAYALWYAEWHHRQRDTLPQQENRNNTIAEENQSFD